MKADEKFINNIYHNVSLEILITYLYKLVYPLIYNVVEEKAKGLLVKEEDKVFIANFYKSAFVALVFEWIKKGMKEEPRDIIKHLSILIEGTIDHSLRNLNK